MIIFRYLTKEVYSTLLGVTGVLLVIFICNQFVHFLEMAADGRLTGTAVMQLMSLQVPILLGLLLPLSLFMGILLVYGRLYVDSEMTVLAACGVSRAQLVWLTLASALGVMVVVGILMLWIQPKLAWYRDHIYAEAFQASPIQKMSAGKFESIGSGQYVIYAQGLSRDHQRLKNVFAAERPDFDTAGPAKSLGVMYAEGGHQQIDPKTHEQYVVFTNGIRYDGIPGQQNYQIAQFKEYGIRVQTTPYTFSGKADFTPTTLLWLERDKSPEAMAELQWRFSLPLSVMVLALLAVPLSRVNPRHGRYLQLIPAVIIYIVYADTLFISQGWLQDGTIPAYIGMWWTHLSFFFLALVLLAWQTGWRKWIWRKAK